MTWTWGSWSEGQLDLYFMVQWFCLISWRLFDVCTSYFGSMNQYDPTFDLKINVGHCDLYSMIQWVCLISWRLFDVWTILFGIMNQYDPNFDRKINIGHYDLYFMVQWLWLMLWRHGLVGHEVKVSLTYISRSSDFVLYLEDYLMYIHHTLGVWISTTRRLI